MDEVENQHGDLLSIADPKNKDFRWTTKKQRFCYYMARCETATEAAIKAGYSEQSANTYAAQLRKKPEIQKAIGQEVRNLLAAAQENEESVVARWSLWADLDIADYFDRGWELKDVEQLDGRQRRRIKKVKITHNQHGRNVDIEFHDAHKANNDLAAFMGMLGKDSGSGDGPDELARMIRGALEEMDNSDAITDWNPEPSSAPH